MKCETVNHKIPTWSDKNNFRVKKVFANKPFQINKILLPCVSLKNIFDLYFDVCLVTWETGSVFSLETKF